MSLRLPEKGSNARVVAKATVYTAGAMLLSAVTYKAQGCAVDNDAAPQSAESNTPTPSRKPYLYTYRPGEPVDAGIIAANPGCDMYSNEDDAEGLLQLRHEVAGDDGIVLAGQTYKIRVLPCAKP